MHKIKHNKTFIVSSMNILFIEISISIWLAEQKLKIKPWKYQTAGNASSLVSPKFSYIQNNIKPYQANMLSCCELDATPTQENSYSISHLLGTVTTQWLDSDGVVTVDNCRR